jgi:hypothetical protein
MPNPTSLKSSIIKELRRQRLMSPISSFFTSALLRGQVKKDGGERGIRTPDRGLAYTRFPSVRLQPLGHLSARVQTNCDQAFCPIERARITTKSVITDDILNGGREGIRTPDTLSGTPVFKTGAINHSATLPLDGRKVARIFPNNQWALRGIEASKWALTGLTCHQQLL